MFNKLTRIEAHQSRSEESRERERDSITRGERVVKEEKRASSRELESIQKSSGHH